jgi:hypothetical protein
MNLPRSKLDQMLDGLEAALPHMLQEHPDDDSFRALFAGNADLIECETSDDDREYVRQRIDRMLANVGKERDDVPISRADSGGNS